MDESVENKKLIFFTQNAPGRRYFNERHEDKRHLLQVVLPQQPKSSMACCRLPTLHSSAAAWMEGVFFKRRRTGIG
jgi:hypothetical protein